MNPRSIFLVDGLGAVLSALLLGLVLPRFQSDVGLPLGVLHVLSLLAVVLAFYSLGCYRFADHSKPVWLRLITAANLAYCALTLGLIAFYYPQLTVLGIAYFVAEIFVVLALVWMERRVLGTLSQSPS